MRTLTLFESGDSSGQVSLRKIFDDPIKTTITRATRLEDLIEYCIRGGRPGSIGLNLKNSISVPKAYLQTIIEEDMRQIDNISRDYRKIQLLLKSLARNESTVVSQTTLRKDINEYDGDDVSLNSISDYLNVLEKLFII